MTVFGDTTFIEVMKVKRTGKTYLSSMAGVLIIRGNLDTDRHTHSRKNMQGHSTRVATCKPWRKVSVETKPAKALILDFQPAEL